MVNAKYSIKIITLMQFFKISLFTVLTFIFYSSTAQDIKLIRYHMVEKTIDTIQVDPINYGSHEQTDFFKGVINSISADLQETFPTENLSGENNFTHKIPAETLYNSSEYPIRTSVRLSSIKNDSIYPRCSGSMVAPNFVLSAAHCVKKVTTPFSFFEDQLIVSPVLDNGTYSPNFHGSMVKYLYVPIINGIIPDIVLLELKEPIGRITGWLGFGFEEDNLKLQDNIFYKFSYPAQSNFLENGLPYNGDTLYCSYGQLDYFTENTIGLIGNSLGIPGESGSTLFAVKHEEFYTAYGVFSTIYNYSHTRITKPIYTAFNHLISKQSIDINPIKLSAYPNPVSSKLYLYNLIKSDFKYYSIYDIHGRLLQTNTTYDELAGISFHNFPRGVYFLSCYLHSGHKTIKIVKQ